MIKKLCVLTLFVIASTALAGVAQGGPTLDKVRQAGQISCGVQTGLAGFAAPDSQGHYAGFNVDICKALSAAIFGAVDKVKYVPLTAQQRFTALQSGEVDLLSNNTTDTLQRDTALGLNFAPVVFYDGQGFHGAEEARGQECEGAQRRDDLRADRNDERAQPCRLLPCQQNTIQAGRYREARRDRSSFLFRALRCIFRRFLGLNADRLSRRRTRTTI